MIIMGRKSQTTFEQWMADSEIKEHFDKDYKDFVLSELIAKKNRKEMKKLPKAIKKKPKRLSCVATEKCQINFEQQ